MIDLHNNFQNNVPLPSSLKNMLFLIISNSKLLRLLSHTPTSCHQKQLTSCHQQQQQLQSVLDQNLSI